jgi:hypothetical protein
MRLFFVVLLIKNCDAYKTKYSLLPFDIAKGSKKKASLKIKNEGFCESIVENCFYQDEQTPFLN